MGKQTPTITTCEFAGHTVELEHGKLAGLADGSVVLRMGKLVLLATAVSATVAKEGMNFFPLTVEYREKFAAAGRIPGNFHRREGRPATDEILTARLIDRVIRPLFADHYKYETQIFVYLLSGDPDIKADALAAFAASTALMTSDIPFQGPISEVRVARVNGEYKVNPTVTELKEADLNFLVGGSLDSIVMVEGEAHECDESELVEAIKVAHESIKIQCQAQLDLRAALGITKNREIPEPATNEALEAQIKEMASAKIYEVARGGKSKLERKKEFEAIQEEVMEKLLEEHGEEYMDENKGLAKDYFGKTKKHAIREMMLADHVRLDGRKADEIRHIWAEVDYLPAAHGCALFTRGETQALATATLGSKLDRLMVDNAMELHYDEFLLHYNFPPFCTNEAKPVRGVSRREIGHGNLARRSLLQVMPPEYAYTVRVVSDVLESNGSSSMATVCSGSLALMDAGVPLKSAVSGIAMGLVTDGERTMVLSDILGDEDHLGDMDFKVTGTADGICACQMDIKIDGIDYDLLTNALKQAREGRLHILGIMNEVMSEARPELKPHTPRIVQYKIPGDKIGAVIGPGGKVIQAIQAETETVINIEEADGKGIVSIMGKGKEPIDKALMYVKGIADGPEVGTTYTAKIVKLMPYGAFIEFLPGQEGLLHVSEIAWERIDNVEDVLTAGETVEVRYMGLDDRTGKHKLSRKVLLPKPEGYVERPPRERRDDRGRGGRDGRPPRRDDRRGGRGDRRDYNNRR